jgi:predicted transcriptional regulator
VKKEEQIDAIALKKLRELKGISRKEAAIILELNYKSVEKFENGSTTLNRTRVNNILISY